LAVPDRRQAAKFGYKKCIPKVDPAIFAYCYLRPPALYGNRRPSPQREIRRSLGGRGQKVAPRLWAAATALAVFCASRDLVAAGWAWFTRPKTSLSTQKRQTPSHPYWAVACWEIGSRVLQQPIG
jgi:hypothetical protein